MCDCVNSFGSSESAEAFALLDIPRQRGDSAVAERTGDAKLEHEWGRVVQRIMASQPE